MEEERLNGRNKVLKDTLVRMKRERGDAGRVVCENNDMNQCHVIQTQRL